MRYDYEYGYQTLPNTVDDEMLLGIGIVLLGVLAVVLLFALIFWVIRSIGLYTVARRRGIRNAWLAWIPIGSDWILGSLSDQYQHLVLGQVKSRRKLLLVLNLLAFVVSIASGVFSVLETFAAATEEEYLTFALVGLIPGLLTVVISITAMVFYHMCNYDLYRSCDPKNAVAYLVIGIFIPVTEPFFYLANRRKDLGMPQRTMEPEYRME